MHDNKGTKETLVELTIHPWHLVDWFSVFQTIGAERYKVCSSRSVRLLQETAQNVSDYIYINYNMNYDTN